MKYTVTHISPDGTPEVLATDRHSIQTATIKAAIHLSRTFDAAAARVFGQQLLAAYTRINTDSETPQGAELTHMPSGSTYRIEPTKEH